MSQRACSHFHAPQAVREQIGSIQADVVRHSTAPLQTRPIRLIANHAVQGWPWIVEGAFATVQTGGVGHFATQSAPRAAKQTRSPVRSRKSTSGELRNDARCFNAVGLRAYTLIGRTCLEERGFCCKSRHAHPVYLPLILGASNPRFSGACEFPRREEISRSLV